MDNSTAINLDTLPTVDTASEVAVVLSKKQIKAICAFASNDDA